MRSENQDLYAPEDRDQYMPPPRYKMRSGAVLQFVILAGLLGAAALAYVSFTSQQQQTARLVPPAQNEQLADAGYQAQPAPDALAPAATTPAPAATEAAPAPAAPARSAATQQRSSSSSESPAQDVPPPSTSIGTPPAG